MPPINQQGSRAGLVTGLVVFVILFVTSAIFAFQYYSKWQQTTVEYKDYQKRYNEIVPSGNASDPTVTDLLAARTEPTNRFALTSTDSAIDVAKKQRETLVQNITGDKATSAASAVDLTAKTLKEAQDQITKAGGKTVGPGLIAMVSKLTETLVASQKNVSGLKADLATANSALKNAQDDKAAAAKANDAALADANAKATAAAAALNGQVDAAKAKADQIKSDNDTAAKAQSDALAQKDSQIATLTQQMNHLNSSVEADHVRLAHRRVDVSNATVRQVDGKLIRVPNTDVCYINLGSGDQVTPGLTFEVYDKADGVPPIPQNATGDEQLPVGKASIEITSVGSTSSECRIVHITPGAVLSEGDPIENLVYDPHTKYNFFIYGNFDLANIGRPNPADGEIIKRLVTQWGGKLTDQVNVDTDFVVLGAEPVLPTFAKEEITAENQAKLDEAQKQLDKYQELLSQAKSLNIPILNQNRFLYYVGFYDQAKR